MTRVDVGALRVPARAATAAADMLADVVESGMPGDIGLLADKWVRLEIALSKIEAVETYLTSILEAK